jgi:hypothetical protein
MQESPAAIFASGAPKRCICAVEKDKLERETP